MRLGRLILAILAPLASLPALAADGMPLGESPSAGASSNLRASIPIIAAVCVHAAQMGTTQLQTGLLFPAPSALESAVDTRLSRAFTHQPVPAPFHFRYPSLLRC